MRLYPFTGRIGQGRLPWRVDERLLLTGDMTACPTCGALNECGCDPNNLPTKPLSQFEAAIAKVKAKYTKCLVLFRVGDCYEAFGADAELLARIGNMTLSSRKGTAMCGFPYHSLQDHVKRIVRAGHRVAVANYVPEQGEWK